MTYDIAEIRSWVECGEAISPRVVKELLDAHVQMQSFIENVSDDSRSSWQEDAHDVLLKVKQKPHD